MLTGYQIRAGVVLGAGSNLGVGGWLCCSFEGQGPNPFALLKAAPQGECHHNWGKDRDFLEGPVGKAGQNRRVSGSLLLSCPSASSQQARSAERHRGGMKDIPVGPRTPEM